MKTKTNNEWEKDFVEKGANIEHDRWARWQKWCHKILRDNCPSPELERVLEGWDKQIATPYLELSEQEKESDRKETRNYLPIVRQLLASERQRLRELDNGKLLDQLYRLEGVLGKYNCQDGGTKCEFQINCHRLIREEIEKLKLLED